MENESSPITHKIDAISDEAEKLEEIASGVNVALTEMRLQFETMMEMQKEERTERERMYNEERIERERMHNEEKSEMRKHYGRIIIGLILTICLILGSIIGGAIYIFSNFDFAVADFTQSVDIGGDGNPIIYDGIHHNAD